MSKPSIFAPNDIVCDPNLPMPTPQQRAYFTVDCMDGKLNRELLTTYGANIVNSVGTGGLTPLICLCALHYDKPARIKQHLTDIETLLIHGANPNAATEKGLTVLMMTADIANIEVAQLLLTYGANVDAVDEKNQSVFHHAAKSDMRWDRYRHEYIQMLIDAGANFEQEDTSHQSALDIAEKRQDKQTAAALKPHFETVNYKEMFKGIRAPLTVSKDKLTLKPKKP